MDWIGFGQQVIGLGWIRSWKLDPRITLVHTTVLLFIRDGQ